MNCLSLYYFVSYFKRKYNNNLIYMISKLSIKFLFYIYKDKEYYLLIYHKYSIRIIFRLSYKYILNIYSEILQ